jgi:hypothetical protein
MPSSPEIPPLNRDKPEFTPKEEAEITREWYFDTSFEGRTKAEFDALRQEVQKSTSLDLSRLRSDQDYSRLIYENPLVSDFLAKSTIADLWIIYEDRNVLGLSEEQFRKLVEVLGSDIQRKWNRELATHKVLKETIRAANEQFTPEELGEHRNETTGIMKKEIGLQAQNIPHEIVMPPLFPQKKQPK